jgi:hypothetical protein
MMAFWIASIYFRPCWENQRLEVEITWFSRITQANAWGSARGLGNSYVSHAVGIVSRGKTEER